MNLYHLYYFRTLAKLQHYTKAATQLSITQPSLSHAISALENELGTVLFEKQGRNVVLTKHGKVFLTYVENALNEIEMGAEKIKELLGNTQGSINIGFIYTLGSHFIPKLITGFRKEKENLNIGISLYEGGTALNECTVGLVHDLKSQKLDLIFASLIPKDPDIEFVPLCEQKLIAILPCDCPISSHGTVDLRDTEPYPLIHYSGKPGLKQEVNRLFAKVNVVPKVSCEVEDEISMAGLVAANVGIAIVPDSPTFRNFRIKTLPISNPSYTRMIYLGYMKNRSETLAVQRFKDYIIKNSQDIIQSFGSSIENI